MTLSIRNLLGCGMLLLGGASLHAQSYVQMMRERSASYEEIRAEFESYWEGRERTRGTGHNPFSRWLYFMEGKLDEHGNLPPANATFEAQKKWQRQYGSYGTLRNATWQALGPTDWTSVGWNPGLGRVNVIVGDPSNADVLYAGTPAGGLWKSVDGGADWTPLTDELGSLGVSGIAIDPTNGDRIFIGTGDSFGGDTYSIGVLKSEDGGTTWQPTGLEHNLEQGIRTTRLLISPADPNTLYLASNAGIFRSTDGASTWEELQDGSFWDLEINPENPQKLYASGRRVLTSADGGDTWQPATGMPSQFDVNRVQIAITPADTSVVYAICGDEGDSGFYGLYRSTDGGLSFEEMSDSPNIFSYAMDGDGNGGQSWYDMALCASPTNADEIWAGGINVWKSADGGASWEISSHWIYNNTPFMYTHADIHYLDYINGALYCGSDGGAFRKGETDSDWEDLTFGMQITQIYRFDHSLQQADRILTGTQDNGTNIMTQDGHLHVLGGDGNGAAIAPHTDDIMYSTYPYGGIQRTTNGGDWFEDISGSQSEEGAWVTPYIVPENSPEELIAGFVNLQRYSPGMGWEQLTNHSTGTIQAMDLSADADTIYYSKGSTLYRYVDAQPGTQSTINTSGGGFIRGITVDKRNANRVWVTYGGFGATARVMYSSNGGLSWADRTLNLPQVPKNCIALEYDELNGVYLGCDLGVYYKNDTLTNWIEYGEGLPNVIVNQVRIHPVTGKLRAATYGRGMWETDLFSGFGPALPVAQIGVGNTLVCQDQAIEFTDFSLLATGERLWVFEGGEPETSTEANPVVTYPASGTYNVSLTVSNENGEVTVEQEIEVVIGGFDYSLNFNFDDYPEETSWTITDASGTTYASGADYDGLTLANEDFCLPAGCYSLNIFDTYGDGICCAYGNGNFTLVDPDGEEFTGGEFEFEENLDFCTPGTNAVTDNQAPLLVRTFPNPADGELYIELPANSYTLSQYELIGASGDVLSRGTLAAGTGRVSLGNLAPGLYLIRISQGEKQTTTRFVKR